MGVLDICYLWVFEVVLRKEGEVHTTSLPRTNSSISRILRIATNVPDSRIQQPLPIKILPEQMLDAPEATGCHGAFLRVVGEGLGGCAGGVEGHACGGGEGAEETVEEGGHVGEGH